MPACAGRPSEGNDMRRRLCAVLLLLAVLGTAPAWASDASARSSSRGAFAALWDRVAASLAQLWERVVFDASTSEEPEPSSPTSTPPPTDPAPEGDAGGVLDPWG
jgi:hypothetical protein